MKPWVQQMIERYKIYFEEPRGQRVPEGEKFQMGLMTPIINGKTFNAIECSMDAFHDHCHLNHLFIHEEYRGRGLGTAVLKQAERQARQVGARYMNVSVGLEGGDPTAFFLRHGYQRGHVGEEKPPLEGAPFKKFHKYLRGGE